MTEFSEDRVYARHPRRTGAVLIVGAGAVGGFLAEELARLGISPLRLVDFDVLNVENLVRHPLGAGALGQPKASALASKISRDFPLCDVSGLDANFLDLPQDEQLRLVSAADVVVAATDVVECQRQVNAVCLAAEQPAVYPAIWVDQRLRDAEVGEILWVLPGRHTPCYLCATAWRQSGSDAEARGGTRADIKVLVLAAVQVVAGLLDRTDAPAGLLDPEQNLIYVHGFSPPSPAVRGAFRGPGLQSQPVHVPFPRTPCPACGGQEATPPQPAPPPRPLTSAPPPLPVTPAPPVWNDEGPRRSSVALIVATIAACALAIAAITLGIVRLSSSASGGQASTLPTSVVSSAPAAQPSQPQPTTAPTSAAAPAPSSPAAPPPAESTAINYSNIGLECVSGCGVINLLDGGPPDVELNVTGISGTTLQSLCSSGYTVQWSDNYGQNFTTKNLGWICHYQLVDIDSPDVASETIPGPTTDYGLGVDGPWKITFQLISPSGQTMADASYQTTVVGCPPDNSCTLG